MKVRRVITLGLLLLGSLVAGTVVADEFAQVTTIPLGGAGRWDYAYFEASSQRVFVTRGDHVDVIDAKSREKLGALTGLQGTHGVAVAPALKKIFVSDGKADAVLVFDTESLALRARIAVPGHNPDAIVLDPATSRVLVFDGQSQDMVVIDAISDAVLAVTKMPGKPEFAAIDGATLYVNIEDKNSLAQVDLPNGRVTAVWPLPGCDEPTGLDMDRKTHRVFSVCGNGVLAVTEVPSGRAIATVPIGAGADAVVFLPARGVILSACGQSGTLDVVTEVTPDQYQRVQSLNTAAKARTMAVDAERARVWLPAPSPDGFRLLELAPRAGQ